MSDSTSAPSTQILPRGVNWLQNPRLNKGTAFTQAERDVLGLRGLLPPRVHTQGEQVMRVLARLRKQGSELDKYVYLMSLYGRNETLFYRVVMDNLEEMMPIIYTPTVGQACQLYGHIHQQAQGMYLCADDRGRIAEILRNWPTQAVRVIVVTDGERILGLGDLGAYGMGIPVGKLALYTACAGVDPSYCLPIQLDTGTDNSELLIDPLYTGLRMRRLRGADYDSLIEEFVQAVQTVFPNALLQFEDFANQNAFRLLEQYQDQLCTFNDDIQGTGAVALAGLYAAMRVLEQPLRSQRVLFFGAGEAAMGIARMVVEGLKAEGLSEAEARQHCWFVDSKGLVESSRSDLNRHKRDYAHEQTPMPDLLSAIHGLRPTALIGASGQGGAFNAEILTAMASYQPRPIIFALSNPTSKSECTAQEAYEYTQGTALFASGSPFDPVLLYGKLLTPGQGNNAYIFPGVGLGVTACGACRVPDSFFFIAAKTLAQQVEADELASGRLYPSLTRIREVSAMIALAVVNQAYLEGLATYPEPADREAHIRAHRYEPNYPNYA